MVSQFDDTPSGAQQEVPAAAAVLKTLKATVNDVSMSDAEFRQAARQLLGATQAAPVARTQWDDR